MADLTAFDVAYRPDPRDLDPVTQVVQDAVDAGRVLTVSYRRLATDVAKHVDATKANVVIVVDDQHTAKGYLFPGYVVGQVRRMMGSSVVSLTEAVDVLSQQPRDISRPHFHEWLNFDRPTLHTCPGKPPLEGQHVTFDYPVPCSRHR